MLMIRFWYGWIFIFILVASTALAQSVHTYTTKSKKAIKLYEESTNYFFRRQYGYALELLNKAVGKDRNFAEAHLRLSKIHTAMGDHSTSRAHLEKVVKSQFDNPSFTEAHLLLANQYFEQGYYTEAKKLINKILSFPKTSKMIQADAQHLLRNIDFTEQAIQHPLPFHPQPVSSTVNQLPLQYFPVLTVDEQTMIFTGRQGITPQYDEDIYFSEKDQSGNWTKPQTLSDHINSPLNEGTCTISADGRTLIFTSCEAQGGFGSCDLYIAKKIGDEWTPPKNLGSSINTGAWESQPSLSADGRMLYFVSDRKGGVGRRDIYVAHMDNTGEWGKAQNVGSGINTDRDEVSPFIHVNGQTLYFSSDGLPGFGGFDLYVAEKIDQGWTAPKNLGYPINTHEDQSGLFITANGESAYYSQEEQRNGEYINSQIYTFVIPEEIRITNRSSYVKGQVFDALSRKPLQAHVELVDLIKQAKVSKVTSDPKNGKFMMVLTEGSDYALYVDEEGYLFQSLTFDYAADQNKINQPVEIDIYLQPIQKGKETVLNNIFFDTDKYEIKEKSKPELNKVLSFLHENPEIRIAINGHTDNVGTAAYNQTLSTNRAKAVYAYLVAAGIDPGRLEYKGYGQTKPIASNDTEEGKQKNRRIAFEIR